MEYYNKELGIRVFLHESNNSIEVIQLEDSAREEQTVSAEDFNEIYEAMQVPGFGWGMVLIKIGKAIERAVTGK